MPLIPIPDDWDGQTWDCMVIEWPDSVAWRALLRGFVSTPARGRFWDGRTGNIKDIQQVGLEIERRNPIMSCEEIVTVLQQIRNAIQQIEVSSESQAVATASVAANIDNHATAVVDALLSQSQSQEQSQLQMTTAIANAYAFSQAFASNFTAVNITNNVNNVIRPIGEAGGEPPTAAEEPETGISSTPQDSSQVERCKRVFWHLHASQQVYHRLNELVQFAAPGLLNMGAVLTEALTLAALRVNPTISPVLIPVAGFLNVATVLSKLAEEQVLLPALQELDDWFSTEFENLWCSIYVTLGGGLGSGYIQELVLSSFGSVTTFPLASSILKLTFNLNSLAWLYYVSPLIPVTLPDIPSPYSNAWCQDNCEQ